MKTGSLVTPINNNYSVIGVIKGSIYTVRDIFENAYPSHDREKILIRLEEYIAPISPWSGNEMGFDLPDFIELQPPFNISDELFSHAPETCEA